MSCNLHPSFNDWLIIEGLEKDSIKKTYLADSETERELINELKPLINKRLFWALKLKQLNDSNLKLKHNYAYGVKKCLFFQIPFPDKLKIKKYSDEHVVNNLIFYIQYSIQNPEAIELVYDYILMGDNREIVGSLDLVETYQKIFLNSLILNTNLLKQIISHFQGLYLEYNSKLDKLLAKDWFFTVSYVRRYNTKILFLPTNLDYSTIIKKVIHFLNQTAVYNLSSEKDIIDTLNDDHRIKINSIFEKWINDNISLDEYKSNSNIKELFTFIKKPDIWQKEEKIHQPDLFEQIGNCNICYADHKNYFLVSEISWFHRNVNGYNKPIARKKASMWVKPQDDNRVKLVNKYLIELKNSNCEQYLIIPDNNLPQIINYYNNKELELGRYYYWSDLNNIALITSLKANWKKNQYTLERMLLTGEILETELKLDDKDITFSTCQVDEIEETPINIDDVDDGYLDDNTVIIYIPSLFKQPQFLADIDRNNNQIIIQDLINGQKGHLSNGKIIKQGLMLSLSTKNIITNTSSKKDNYIELIKNRLKNKLYPVEFKLIEKTKEKRKYQWYFKDKTLNNLCQKIGQCGSHFSIENDNFNRSHFSGGIPEYLRGLGLGKHLYLSLIRYLGHVSTANDAKKEAVNTWLSIAKRNDIEILIVLHKKSYYLLAMVELDEKLIRDFIRNKSRIFPPNNLKQHLNRIRNKEIENNIIASSKIQKIIDSIK